MEDILHRLESFNEYAIILTRKGEKILVDTADYERFSKFTWYINSWGYAVRFIRAGGKKFCIQMHREVMGLVMHDGKIVDHVNRMKLDNRRANLRLCTAGQNIANSGPKSHNRLGVKGVRKYRNKFQAKITIAGRRKFLGSFATAEEASEFFDLASVLLHGSFAPQEVNRG